MHVLLLPHPRLWSVSLADHHERRWLVFRNCLSVVHLLDHFFDARFSMNSVYSVNLGLDLLYFAWEVNGCQDLLKYSLDLLMIDHGEKDSYMHCGGYNRY